MRNGVEGDAVGEGGDFQLVLGSAVQESASLIVQLGHGRRAGAGSGLVGGHHDALDGREVVERLQRDDHLDGGAVRVRNNAIMPRHILRVHLGHHQGHVLIHAEGAGVVDHHGTGGGDRLAHLLGHGGAGREQRDVDALEGLRRHLLHGKLAGRHESAPLEGHLLASRARARKSANLTRREVHVMQHAQKLLSHRTRRSRYGHHRICRHFLRPGHLTSFLHFGGDLFR